MTVSLAAIIFAAGALAGALGIVLGLGGGHQPGDGHRDVERGGLSAHGRSSD